MSPSLHSLLLYCQDPIATADFYKQLGFSDISTDDRQTRVKSQNMTLCYLDQAKAEFPLENSDSKGVGLYIYFQVEKIDDYHKSLIDKGLKPATEPRDWPWGKREFVIRDPDGYKLVFYQNI